MAANSAALHATKKAKKLKQTGNGAAEPAQQPQHSAELNGGATNNTTSQPDSTKLAKLKKKERKRLAALAAQEAALPAGAAVDATDAAVQQQQKKLKKKKRKVEASTIPVDAAAADRAEALLVAEASAPQPASEPPKKKKKKHAVSSDGMADVGDRDLAKLGQPIVKALYSEHPEVTRQAPEEVAQLRSALATVVEGSNMRPVQTFEQTGFPAEILTVTRSFAQPSPIQANAWPIVASGRDFIGIAATGSGKTLAFGLPALLHIRANQQAGVIKAGRPAALMLAPTRELAQQISAVMEEAGAPCAIRTLCAYGGVPKPPQVKALRRGVEVVVATPGRLEDLVQEGSASLNGVTYLVLDEADRMLDLGFEPHIRAIAQQTRADRQTLMFSATWPAAIQKLAAEFLADPVKVSIGSQDLSASHSVSQSVEVLDPRDRDRRLEELLRKHHASRSNRIIIFVLYKKEAARVEAMLSRKGWKAVAVHGDASQHQRTANVELFKAGKVPLLIATDVAARGLDIPDVEMVINYSFPLTTEDYVHRIGRTGRAGKTGIAHTFFSGQTDKARAGELINVLREAGQKVPQELLAFGTTVKKKESKLYGAHFKDVDFSKKATKMSFDSDDDE